MELNDTKKQWYDAKTLDGHITSGSGCKYDAIFTSIAASYRLIISNWTFPKSSGFMQHVYLVKSP